MRATSRPSTRSGAPPAVAVATARRARGALARPRQGPAAARPRAGARRRPPPGGALLAPPPDGAATPQAEGGGPRGVEARPERAALLVPAGSARRAIEPQRRADQPGR